MKPQLQFFEVEAVIFHDYNFAIEHAAGGQSGTQRIEQLGKITVERFFVAALDEDFVLIAKDQGAKSIPFRFENPISAGWQFLNASGKHWQDRWVDGKLHEVHVIPAGIPYRPQEQQAL